MRLIVVRHGETDWNAQDRLQGQIDIPLNDCGRKQAQRLAGQLMSEPISIAFSSDLERAVDTARSILQYHPSVPMNYTSQLRERSYGKYEGRTLAEMKSVIDNSGSPFYLFRPDGGESFVDLQQRALSFYGSLRESYSPETVLIVTHGGFIQSLLVGLDGGNESWGWSFEQRQRYRHQNTGYSILQVEKDGTHRYEAFNRADHLIDTFE
ncbi:histidine phosphatase family protein [Candidatus Woesearchaeota archaeon]|nr:histidine phosphatase family protein [Candidatus Woesearchaeota archaeon]